MITLASFIFTLAVLIAIHEYGHFQAARWCGVKVLKFSLGFGKAIYSKHIGRDRTEFAISVIPLGGFVKMLDERELAPEELAQYDAESLNRAFNRQSVWKRMAIVIAGPAANLLLAILLYWVLMMQGVTGIKPVLGEVAPESAAGRALLKQGDLIHQVADEKVSTWQDVQWSMLKQAINKPNISIQTINSKADISQHQLNLSTLNKEDFEGDFLSKLGLKPSQPKVLPVIGNVLKDSPAQKAGLIQGDQIIAANGVAVDDWQALVSIVQVHAGKLLLLNIKRGNQNLELKVTPDIVHAQGKSIGQIGAVVAIDEKAFSDALITTSYSSSQAILKSINKTWETSVFSLKMMGNMLTGQASIKSISGPVTIANYAGQSAHLGIKAFIGFLAMISISLGVLNLLPIPVLDGGHLLYYTVELIKGSPVSEKTMEIGQRIGLTIIFMLMMCAVYNDINRLIAG